MSNAQRSTLKWEKEETLGEMATVAPVLYTNVNFPSLREEFPDWATRVKQIAKLWRKASSEERAPYVQKARDNRAALRINKVQMSSESLKRQQQPDLFDRGAPLDAELIFREPLKHKESEHEQEWKLRQQMRQKSKQQAKIEATQKLEQVKNEQQLQQQQLQYSRQSGGESAFSGNRSATPPESSSNSSPLQPITPKEGLATSQLPGTPSSSPSDDVFVRPQPPLPATTRTPAQDGCFPGQQPLVSHAQSFPSTSSASRPTSPWDPFAKMMCTAGPPQMGSSTAQRTSMGTLSPAHEPFGSPMSINCDIYTKQLHNPRLFGDPFVEAMGPPSAGLVPESTGRNTAGDRTQPGSRGEAYLVTSHNRMILSDPYSRPQVTPIPGGSESESLPLFKAPMPPPQSQDPFGSKVSTLQHVADESHEKHGFSQNEESSPYAHPPLTRPSMNHCFSAPSGITRHPHAIPFSAPSPMSQHPHRDSFIQPHSAPRPDYLLRNEPSAGLPGIPRPPIDPYSQPPGPSLPPNETYVSSSRIPVSSADPHQLPRHPRPGLDPYFQQSCSSRPTAADQYPPLQASERPSPSQSVDPYAYPSGTPRPTEIIQRSGTARPVLNDPYALPPGNPHPGACPADSFTRPGTAGPQTPEKSSLMDNGFAQLQLNQDNQTCDVYKLAPGTHYPRSAESLPRDVKDQPGMGYEGDSKIMGQLLKLPQSTGNTPDSARSGVQPPLVESEERLKQHQRLRELILQQQQQKGCQELPTPQAPASTGAPPPWSPEDPGYRNDLFARPPPPYPGMLTSAPTGLGGQSFPGPFPSDQPGPFPPKFTRPQFAGDITNVGMRPHGPRCGITSGGQGGQQHFLHPPHPMQGSMMDFPQQMRRSLSIDSSQSPGGNPGGLPQRFPFKSAPMQQHNIMGQHFIELRHHAPENRLRLPFASSAITDSNLAQQPLGSWNSAGQAFEGNPGLRTGIGVMAVGQTLELASHLPVSSSFENLHQHLAASMGAGLQHPPLLRSLSQPANIESFGIASLNHLALEVPPSEQPVDTPLADAEGMGKLGTDDSAVKDLEDVEVKDLVDEDLENLNLDPDDGKDLVLEANDLHLDDLLTSGKFDIIAYTDPELDLGDKKDMFNEELDLSDPIDEHFEPSETQKVLSEKRNTNLALFGSAPHFAPKGEKSACSFVTAEQSLVEHEIAIADNTPESRPLEHTVKTEVKDEMSHDREISCGQDQASDGSENQESLKATQACVVSALPGPPAILPSLIVQEKQEETGLVPNSTQPLDPLTHTNLATGLHQNQGLKVFNHAMIPVPDHLNNPNLRMDMDASFGPSLGNSVLLQPPCQSFGVIVRQGQPGLPMGGQPFPRSLAPPSQQAVFLQDQGLHTTAQHSRPLLLDEQPLLLQDLLDQERQEQQQQRQMQAMIQQHSGDTVSSIDFDEISDPIMKAKMVALKGINKVMAQNSVAVPPMVTNRNQPGGQPAPEEPCPDGGAVLQCAVGPDLKGAQHLARLNPPNLSPRYPNNTQDKQFEDWLKETQQLLQMQQKFLEEKIAAHRKSKKALSAKRRAAKKAGRVFAEEDEEQLKHVTEQQSLVQKRLEQIRKQLKEHAELIEQYRAALQPPMMSGAPPQGAVVPRAQPSGPVLPGPMGQPMMGHIMQMQPPHLGQPVLPHMMGAPGWQPAAPASRGHPSRIPPHLTSQMPLVNSAAQPSVPSAGSKPSPARLPPVVSGTGKSDGNDAPLVKFDDNNPFSEGFQERERRERLHQQQEQQRVQLMQEVERQRDLQQSMLGAESNRMALCDSDLTHGFMQPQTAPHQQQQMGTIFPQQQGMQPGFTGVPPCAPIFTGGVHQPVPGSGHFPADIGPNFQSKDPMLSGPGFPLEQARPTGFRGTDSTPEGGNAGPPLDMEPTTILPSNFPESGKSLIRRYSNVAPDEKGKRKRNRKKRSDEDSEPVKTASPPHSDLATPFTPFVSSTPTRSNMQPGDPNSSALEAHQTGNRDTESQPQKVLSEIKLENEEAGECREPGLEESAGSVEVEEGTSPISEKSTNELRKNEQAPPALLRHVQDDVPSLDNKTDSRTAQKHTPADTITMDLGHQLPGNPDMASVTLPEQGKKKQRKRLPKSLEKPVSRYKKRKKEEEQQMAYTNTDALMTQLKQELSLLPLMEPMIGVNFAHFPPYGCGLLNGESRLSGTFGSGSLDGASDYYSQLIYKQSHLSNPPTPPASLPPTPPPPARQKVLNGFATAEELARKAAVMGGHNVDKSLLPKQFQTPFRPEDLLARAIAQGPKTVHVPASLPTPPHNNQEEVRSQERCVERDTPESLVPSSSPDSVLGVEMSRYPDLSLVKQERPSPAPSPLFPLLPAPQGKGTEARQREVKTEPKFLFPGPPYGQPPNSSQAGLVSVAIRLNPAAAENVPDVVAAVADLLCVKIPGSYEVSHAPDRGSLALLYGHQAPQLGCDPQHSAVLLGPGTGPQSMMRFLGTQGMGPSQSLPQANLGLAEGGDGCSTVKGDPDLKALWCCHCKGLVLGIGVRKSIKDLPCFTQETRDSRANVEGSLVFCSHNCSFLFSAAVLSQTIESKSGKMISSACVVKESPFKIQHQYSSNMSTLDVHCLSRLQPKPSPPCTPPIFFLAAGSDPALKVELKPDSLKMMAELKALPLVVHNGTNRPPSPGKRWKGLRWRRWSIHIVVPKGDFRQPDEDELLQRLGSSLQPEPAPRDLRKCCFCQEEGDGLTDGPARLLNLDLDLWVHLNCALWSTEVYETQAGALINVELALGRGLSVRCVHCQRVGATSGCHRLRCTNVYHFTCALRAHCTFFKDKTMLCHQHRPRGGATQGQELRYFAVFRRVYVQRDEVRQLATVVRRPERDHTFRVGSLIFHAVGQLLPQQMAVFHGPTAIFPPGYEASRIYWSMRHGNRRCRYLCSIDEKDNLPEFSIRVLEQGYEDLLLTDSTPKGVWDKVLGPVAERRSESGTLKLFPVYLKGEDLFGLTVSAVTRIMESLPGVEACQNYTFRYGRNPLMELPLVFNPSGSARSQSKSGPDAKRPRTLTSSGSTRPLQSASSGELGTPYSKQFVHSKSSQYRRLKSEWKSNVFLARSGIQGLGLFAARDIEKYTMVIEYIGTVMRNELADRKQKLYESKNRIAYMFRLDSDHVIDATLTGGPARYINHSCAPNCVAEVVTFERGHRIIITSVRKIQKGEELCYDYKFDLEDEQQKIPCHCGAVNCRKWMY